MSLCDGATGAKLLVQYSGDSTLEWNNAGHVWTDIRNVTGQVEVGGGERDVSEYKTFGVPQIGTTEPGMIDINISVVFQNAQNSFLEFLTDRWESGQCFFLRYAYNNGAAGALRRTSSLAKVVSNPLTGGDANSAQPLVKQIKLVCATINRDVVPAS